MLELGSYVRELDVSEEQLEEAGAIAVYEGVADDESPLAELLEG